MQPLETGDPAAIGSYRLLGRLGAGGMGRVYLGRSPGGRTVAVKTVRAELASDVEFRDRFRREVAAARTVGGAWTAPVLDADTESLSPWVATGYVAGPALSDAVADFGALSEHGARVLAAGLAEALAAVHGRGLIHRDIKPSNVMLSPDGPVLIDFGIARAMDVTSVGLTSTGVVVGSPGYMSPEQVQGLRLGAASDVFQLGTVLVYAVTGRGPFVADSAAALLYKVAHGEPELGSMHGELRTLAEACLAKDPAARPSPQQIAARLAPGGASTLIRQGWLAEPLMAQLSRRMVELLNLETVLPVPGAQQPPAQAAPGQGEPGQGEPPRTSMPHPLTHREPDPRDTPPPDPRVPQYAMTGGDSTLALRAGEPVADGPSSSPVTGQEPSAGNDLKYTLFAVLLIVAVVAALIAVNALSSNGDSGGGQAKSVAAVVA
ncbi:serine/threonine-protein kinase [Streptacidiphilus sp. EB129]|uniref:serine/threonine-protein kinase n=1 Tax=Streptacidiphilus sp. EB129 TaxID=3156262 RepID=UPI003514800C